MEKLARDKCVPLVMSADAAVASSAQEKIAAIRAEAGEGLPMTRSGVQSAEVFAHNRGA